MKVFLKSRKGLFDAKGEFDFDKKIFTVLKGSKVSIGINNSPKFRGAKTIEKYRNECVKDSVVIKTISFKSPSTAANFVTGNSTNGYLAWKDKMGRPLKEIIGGNEDE